MEELILYLARFGRPHLWRMSDGEWACRLEMFVTGQGISFEVKCVNGQTPMDALKGCKANMEAALTQLTTNLPTLEG